MECPFWRWLRFAAVFSSVCRADAADVQFNRDVRPILSATCFQCHGFDSKTRKADLRLDVPEGAFANRDGAAPIVPGDPNKSEVWRRISSSDPDEVMPPPSFRHQLTAEQKETLRQWIEQGAAYQKHWAFEPPAPREIPVLPPNARTLNPIDAFIVAKLQEAGLGVRRSGVANDRSANAERRSPNAVLSPEADRPTLIRRAAFALTGLPPTIAEVDQFLNDRADGAYERMVQRYLDSPRYGEEMARHWLDVARYADTHGLHLDNEREMWAYRDWVIDAFNRNLPFDQFTVEQLAGDLLPNPTREQLIATGFNRCNVTTSEGGSIEAEFLYRYAVERASTTVQTWLGLTAGCAVCHDHKYDPLSMQEFYSLYAFFYSAADPAMDRNIRNTEPFLSLATPQQKAELERLREREKLARNLLAQSVLHMPADASAFSHGMEPVADVWLDDDFPQGVESTSTSRNASTWATHIDEMPPPLGQRALTQAGGAMYQDKFDCGPQPFVVPERGRLQVWVHPDRFEPPQTLAVVISTRSKGTRRVHWGDGSKLDGALKLYGGSNPEQSHAGELPPRGRWTHLEVPFDELKLPAGEPVTSIALVQFGGRVAWDGLQAVGFRRPIDDPYRNFAKWLELRKGQDTPGVPDAAKAALKNGPDHKDTTADQLDALHHFWMTAIAKPASRRWQQHRDAAVHAEIAVRVAEDVIPGTFIFKDLAQPRDAFVMLRGQYDKPGDKVEPGFPAVIGDLGLGLRVKGLGTDKDRAAASSASDSQPSTCNPQPRLNRLDLAQWLVAPQQPLTARVTVNRFWQQFFGTGLVKTSDDFGSQGDPPSHPELLDWLAVWYRDSGWNTKELVRLMVTSATFRQSAAVSPEVLARDPQNRLYARGPRFRLDAEQVRDNALFVSGLLNPKMGGPGVKPYQPPNIWEPVGYSDSNTRYYLQDHGRALYRRSIYAFLKRTAPPPFMSNFDGPNREQFCTRRERSNTPLQALQLMNDTQHFEAARAFAERILEEGGGTPESRIEFACRTVLSRSPEADELQILLAALNDSLARYRADENDAAAVLRVGESPVRSRAKPVELAAWTLVANLLLNLDETVTRN